MTESAPAQADAKEAAATPNAAADGHAGASHAGCACAGKKHSCTARGAAAGTPQLSPAARVLHISLLPLLLRELVLQRMRRPPAARRTASVAAATGTPGHAHVQHATESLLHPRR